ncbi:hypothetical protein [Paenibacillus xerothermodurans]|uniref:Uncharacterized protein n=1 Tax=Paenibacillus xerothermodurans TaxID=1977292 RepID=A0A2W1NCI7_PAEXE|nr:hypothetical protein [Paenibacillus xerothermodurans]PZE22429.1 hypothetical protein CBW46_001195 [Paenibacillus xerothermodurans]
MMGTIRWNLIIGSISFLLTFLISLGNNIWLTTLLRSLYSFLLMFVLVFLFRWVLGTIAGLHKLGSVDVPAAETDDDHIGNALDMSTPDEQEALHAMLKQTNTPNEGAANAGFKPLTPPKLSSSTTVDTAEMAQAVRRMTEE